MLLSNLPRESSFVRAVHGDAVAWGDVEHLLAGLIDVVQLGNYLTEVIASGRVLKGHTPKPPRALERPGEAPARVRSPRANADTRARLAAWRAGELAMTPTTQQEVT